MAYNHHKNVSSFRENEDCQVSMETLIGTYTKIYVTCLTRHSNHRRIHFGILAFIHFAFNELVTSCYKIPFGHSEKTVASVFLSFFLSFRMRWRCNGAQGNGYDLRYFLTFRSGNS